MTVTWLCDDRNRTILSCKKDGGEGGGGGGGGGGEERLSRDSVTTEILPL